MASAYWPAGWGCVGLCLLSFYWLSGRILPHLGNPWRSTLIGMAFGAILLFDTRTKGDREPEKSRAGFLISSSVIDSGGAILKAVVQKRNQSNRMPCCMANAIHCRTFSNEPSSTAMNSPDERQPLTAGCLARSVLNSSAFFSTPSISLSSIITLRDAKAAAQETGCPPNVVMCPSGGLCVMHRIILRFAIKAPSGNPPPNALARSRISGTTPYFSNANIRPVLPNPV